MHDSGRGARCSLKILKVVINILRRILGWIAVPDPALSLEGASFKKPDDLLVPAWATMSYHVTSLIRVQFYSYYFDLFLFWGNLPPLLPWIRQCWKL